MFIRILEVHTAKLNLDTGARNLISIGSDDADNANPNPTSTIIFPGYLAQTLAGGHEIRLFAGRGIGKLEILSVYRFSHVFHTGRGFGQQTKSPPNNIDSW